jgi:hypothetical protein
VIAALSVVVVTRGVRLAICESETALPTEIARLRSFVTKLTRTVAVAEDVAEAGLRVSSAGTLRVTLALDVPCDERASSAGALRARDAEAVAELAPSTSRDGADRSIDAELCALAVMSMRVGAVTARLVVQVACAAPRPRAAPPDVIPRVVEVAALTASSATTVWAFSASVLVAEPSLELKGICVAAEIARDELACPELASSPRMVAAVTASAVVEIEVAADSEIDVGALKTSVGVALADEGASGTVVGAVSDAVDDELPPAASNGIAVGARSARLGVAVAVEEDRVMTLVAVIASVGVAELLAAPSGI